MARCDSKRLWFHGDTSRRLTFEDQRFQNAETPNAGGPGIYFTSSMDQARGYAWPEGWLYAAQMKTGSRCTDDRQRMTPRQLRKFVSLLDVEQREMLFSNWDEDPRAAYAKIADGYTTSGWRDGHYVMPLVDAAADLGRQGGLDYMREGRAWAKLMVDLGYDAYLHAFDDVDHLVVWNPGAFVIRDERHVPRRSLDP